MKKGLWLGSFLFGAEQKLFGGNVPWMLHNHADHTAAVTKRNSVVDAAAAV